MSMKYSFRFFLSLLILLSANALFAGDWLSLAEKVFKSHLIVEVELKFDKPIPKNWKSKKYDPAGWAFPQALIVRAKKTAKILSVLKSPNEHDSFVCRRTSSSSLRRLLVGGVRIKTVL